MKSAIKILKKATFVFVNMYVYIITRFYKRDKHKIIIGAWDGLRYADNSRYLYEFLCKTTDYSVTWATKNQEIYEMLKSQDKKVVLMGTRESYKAHISAYYHIVCTAYTDISGEYSWGAYKINLWHGLPIKLVSKLANKAGYKQRTFIHELNIYSRIKEISIFNPGGWNRCYYISPGLQGDRGFLEDFQINKKWIIHANYPRNYTENSFLEDELVVRNTMIKYKHRIIYLPTFRENQNEKKFDPIGNEKIRDILLRNNIIWIDKKHFASNVKTEYKDDMVKNILHLNGTFDIYSIIDMADIIISDYSSVYYDGLYHLKKIILYMPDYDYYKTSDRGFLCDPSKLQGCAKVYTINELAEKILDFLPPLSKERQEELQIAKMNNWSYPNEETKSIWDKIVRREKR